MRLKNFIRQNKDIDSLFESFLLEEDQQQDRGTLKAIFLVGGPGSGKDYVLSNTVDNQGLTEISLDKINQYLSDKDGINNQIPENEQEQAEFFRKRAKNVVELRQILSVFNRNGLIVNGPSDKFEKVKKAKVTLENLGYTTFMIMVNTSDEVSQMRNEVRALNGGRKIPERTRKNKWDLSQYAKKFYEKLFDGAFVEFDNSEDLTTADLNTIKRKKEELAEISEKVAEFIEQDNQAISESLDINTELQQLLSENYSFTDNLDVLTLGKQMAVVGEKIEQYTFTEEEVKQHVKLAERENQGFVEERGSSCSDSYRGSRKKISLKEIRNRKKENGYKKEENSCQKEEVIESIDRGIETGTSMAGAGESIGRDMGEKINKKGKATPVVNELTGDENLATMSAQKEDELSKQGIRLATFKSKKHI